MNYQSSHYSVGNYIAGLTLSVAAALVMTLAGCVALPPKDAAPVLASAQPADIVADDGFAADGAADDAYGDPQLRHLIALALADSPTMAVARARVSQADAETRQTQAAAGASVSLSAQATTERYSRNGFYPPPIAGSWQTSGDAALDFSYDFDFWGRNRSALDAAIGRAAAERADGRAAAATLANAVARAYLQWQADDQHLSIAQQLQAQRQALVDLQARRVRAGLAAGEDLQPLRADAAGPRQTIVQLETQRAQAARQLQALVGVHALPPLAAAPLPAIGGLPDAGARLDLLARRPEIAAARDRVQAALKDVDSQRAAFYPDVSLSALAGFDSLKLGSLLHGANREIGATPAIHLPIFDAGSLRAGLDARRADTALAVAQYDQALQSAIADVNDATLRLQGAEREREPLAAQARAREHELASAQARERAGLIDGQARLADQLALTALQDQELTRRTQAVLARVDFDHALGGAVPAEAIADAAPSPGNTHAHPQ